MLSDIFPTGFHGAYTAGVEPGSTVYIAGAGPVGLAAAVGAQLLGAAVVIVGDLNEERLAQARSFGCETVDVSQGEPPTSSSRSSAFPRSTAAVDAVGFEARGHGADASHEAPATVLNSLMQLTAAGGGTRHPGPVRHRRPRRGIDEAAKVGSLSLRLGTGLGQVAFLHDRTVPRDEATTGSSMMAILHDKVQIAKAVNATPIPLARGSARATPSSTRAPRRSTSSIPTAT